MNIKIVNFDMDGTIADLYAVKNLLPKLQAYDSSPYVEAAPLVHMSTLARYIHIIQRMGWKVNIVSWLSKDPDPDYDEAVTRAKRTWLAKHLPSVDFDAVIIVPYGTPKHELSSGILFDDELNNRVEWSKSKENRAFDETTIFEVLKLIAAGGL